MRLTPPAPLAARLDPAVRRLAAARRFRVWVALLALAAAACCGFPLFDVLGFEFAFAIALPASLAAADLGAWTVRRARLVDRPEGPAGRIVAVLVGRAVRLALATLILPLAIVALDALRVRTCDPLFGLAAYAALPVASAILMAGTGVALGVLAGERRRLSNALPYLAALAIVLGAGLLFYGEPPVFFYNVLIGYFPGNLYDEDVVLSAPLLWSRLYQAATVVGLLAAAAATLDPARLALARRRPRGARPIVLALAAAATALALRVHAGALGFIVTVEDVADFLGGRYETEHFVIHYPAGGEIGEHIALIAEDHEFRLAQLRATLGLPPGGARIRSFYFADADDKARFMGARNVYMAKPWRREIYLHHADFPHPVLRHEIAHVVAGEFGDALFHVSARRILGVPAIFNVGLIEGIAVAADWPDHFDRALTPHESVKAMRELGLAPPVERLLSTGFFAFSSARSYTVAGSLLRFLLETRGAGPLRELYRSGGDFAAAYGDSRAAILAEWSRMIDAIELPPGAAEIVKERFRKPSIFARPCPHAVAAARREAAVDLGRGRRDDAIEGMRRVCGMMPGEPAALLDLARLLADDDPRAGAADQAARHAEARPRLGALAADAALSSSIRAEAAVELAALMVRAGEPATAAAALDAAAALPLDDDLSRSIAGRRVALAHAGPAAAALRAYFFGREPTGSNWAALRVGRAAAIVLAEPELALGRYLYGRNLAASAPAAEAVPALSRALDLGLTDVRFERACATLLAEIGYAAGDVAAVERAIGIMTRADQPAVTRLYGEDFRQRLAFARGRRAG